MINQSSYFAGILTVVFLSFYVYMTDNFVPFIVSCLHLLIFFTLIAFS